MNGVVSCEGEGVRGEVGEDDLGVREGGGEGEAERAGEQRGEARAVDDEPNGAAQQRLGHGS